MSSSPTQPFSLTWRGAAASTARQSRCSTDALHLAISRSCRLRKSLLFNKLIIESQLLKPRWKKRGNNSTVNFISIWWSRDVIHVNQITKFFVANLWRKIWYVPASVGYLHPEINVPWTEINVEIEDLDNKKSREKYILNFVTASKLQNVLKKLSVRVCTWTRECEDIN
jgi:hypothetical protein